MNKSYNNMQKCILSKSESLNSIYVLTQLRRYGANSLKRGNAPSSHSTHSLATSLSEAN